MTILHRVRQFALKFGIEVNWYNPAQSQRARMLKLLASHDIDTVLDVGANDGGYGRYLRESGYRGDILSFEPLPEAYQKLITATNSDESWVVAQRMALGDVDGEIEINVATNSTSSSVLSMLESHLKAAPNSKYIRSEHVPLHRLDGISHEFLSSGRKIYLKIDTQGYELPVLRGAEKMLSRVHGIQLEMSLIPLYQEQALYREAIDWMGTRGFSLWNIIPGFVDQSSGRMLQMDGVFFRD